MGHAEPARRAEDDSPETAKRVCRRPGAERSFRRCTSTGARNRSFAPFRPTLTQAAASRSQDLLELLGGDGVPRDLAEQGRRGPARVCVQWGTMLCHRCRKGRAMVSRLGGQSGAERAMCCPRPPVPWHNGALRLSIPHA